jgi:hypothetical protein
VASAVFLTPPAGADVQIRARHHLRSRARVVTAPPNAPMIDLGVEPPASTKITVAPTNRLAAGLSVGRRSPIGLNDDQRVSTARRRSGRVDLSPAARQDGECLAGRVRRPESIAWDGGHLTPSAEAGPTDILGRASALEQRGLMRFGGAASRSVSNSSGDGSVTSGRGWQMPYRPCRSALANWYRPVESTARVQGRAGGSMGWSAYGAIVQFALERDRVLITLGVETAAKLGGATEYDISFPKSLFSVGWRRFATSDLLDRRGDRSANIRVVVSGGFEIGEIFPSTGSVDPRREASSCWHRSWSMR